MNSPAQSWDREYQAPRTASPPLRPAIVRNKLVTLFINKNVELIKVLFIISPGFRGKRNFNEPAPALKSAKKVVWRLKPSRKKSQKGPTNPRHVGKQTEQKHNKAGNCIDKQGEITHVPQCVKCWELEISKEMSLTTTCMKCWKLETSQEMSLTSICMKCWEF